MGQMGDNVSEAEARQIFANLVRLPHFPAIAERLRNDLTFRDQFLEHMSNSDPRIYLAITQHAFLF